MRDMVESASPTRMSQITLELLRSYLHRRGASWRFRQRDVRDVWDYCGQELTLLTEPGDAVESVRWAVNDIARIECRRPDELITDLQHLGEKISSAASAPKKPCYVSADTRQLPDISDLL